MTYFFYEYEIRKQFQELQALDQRLERWGWFRGNETSSAAPGWRLRVGNVLICVGRWMQGRGETERFGVSGRP
jgi:hypothetical protein